MLEYLCSNKNCKEYAKELRKNMTKEEKYLWYDFFEGIYSTVQKAKSDRKLYT